MELQVQGHKTYVYTGGRPFDLAKPSLVFLHGVLHDHSVWILQSRFFAHHGWNVLAPDLPGHCRSEGPPCASVQEAADFVTALLDAADVQKAALIGHSMGSLIALEAAARLKERVSHLVLVGTASPMRVSQALLDASKNDPQAGIRMINQYSRSTLAPPPSALGPGTWVHGANMALNRRVLASNSKFNLFHIGFKASDSYANGEAAISRVTCPIQFLLGTQDQMTTARAAQPLIAAAKAAGKSFQVSHLQVGHHQMTETPEETLFAMREFLSK